MSVKILDFSNYSTDYVPTNETKIYKNHTYTVYNSKQPLNLVSRVCLIIKAIITLFQDKACLQILRNGYREIKAIFIQPENSLKAVKQNGLHYTSEDLKQEVALADKQNVIALESMPDGLRQDSLLKDVKHSVIALGSVPVNLKQDEEFFLKAIKRNAAALATAPVSLKRDREFFLKAIKRNVAALGYASKDLKKDREFFLEAIKHDIAVLTYAHADLKQDRDFFLAAIKHDMDVLIYAHNKLRQDREFFLEAIKHNMAVLTYAHVDLNKDRDFFLKAIKHDMAVLTYAHADLRKDRDFFLEAIKYSMAVLEYGNLRQDRKFFLEAIKYDVAVLEYAHEELRQDREFFLEAVTHSLGVLKYAPESMKKDREFALAAVKQNGLALEWVDYYLRQDREIALAAVEQDGLALQHACYTLQGDKEIVLAAVKQNDLALQYVRQNALAFYYDVDLEQDREVASVVMKKNGLENLHDNPDKEIVLIALRRNGLILQYIPDNLRGNKEIALTAINQIGAALKYVHDDLQKDKEFILEVVKQDASALQYVHSDLQKDKEFMLELVKQDASALQYVHRDLQKDKEFMLEVVKQNGLALQYVSFKEPVIIEAAHQSLGHTLQLWLDDPQQAKPLFKYASYIVENQLVFCLHDEHPLFQKAIEAYSIASQIEDSKSPYQLHFNLQKIIREEELLADFEGFRKRANKKIFTFADIPDGIIPLQTLFKTMEQRGVNEEEVANLCCGANLQQIKANVLGYGTVIASLLTERGKKEDPLPLTSMYLYSILKQISDADDTRQGGYFSPRENQLLKFASMVKECSTGQRDAIEQYYIHTIGIGSISSSQNKIETAIDGAMQMTLKKALASDELLEEIGSPGQQSHQILYLQNRYHRQIGLVHTLTFDRYAGLIIGDLIQKDPKEVIIAIKRHLRPIESAKQVLDQLLAKKEITYVEFVDYFQKECDLVDDYEQYIEFDEDANPVGITSFAVEKALKQLEYIK